MSTNSPITSSPASPSISIVVPVYRCLTLDKDLQKIHNTLATLHTTFEVLCVIDGTDASNLETLQLANSLKLPHLKVLSYAQNKGKGYAVRYGMKKATGDYIGFIDAGNDIHADGLIIAYKMMKKFSPDMMIGNKKDHLSQVDTTFIRRTYSKVLHQLVKLFFELEVTDTQVGLKLFQKNVIKDTLPQLRVNRWAFDVELLAVARKRGYAHILEFPVELTYNFNSNVNISALFNFLFEFFLIFINMNILKKYD